MRESVLITGASGFLGYHLIKAALAQDLEVFAGVRKSSQVSHLKELPVKYVYLNYEDIKTMSSTLAENKIDYIIHAAGITKAVKREHYNTINATFSVNLAKAACLAGPGASPCKKMVFISSLAAAGPLNDASGTITEQTGPAPVTAYGKSKLLAEEELSKTGISLIILRPTAIYGPRDKDIFIMLKTVSKGFDPYMGKILQQLSFVHARDIADIAVRTLFINKTGVYNISDGNNYSRYQFADITKKLLGIKAFRLHLPMPLIKTLAYFLETISGWSNKPAVITREKLQELTAVNWICDISKAKRELGFNPRFNLQTGLKDSIEWYRENKML